MKHRLIIIFSILFSLNNIFGQITNECFENVIFGRNNDIKSNTEIKPGDNANFILESIDTTLSKIIGCRFPYSPFMTTIGKELNYNKIKSDYIIVNFNYLYCDKCINQLDSLLEIKKESKKAITIVSFFACNDAELINLTEKYKTDIYFVANSEKYIEYYGLKCGYPLNFILNNTKTIIYANQKISKTINKYLTN